MPEERIVVTGAGAICGAGRTPEAIWDALAAGRSAVAPIRQWDSTGWPAPLAAEVAGVADRVLVEDRKLHKFIRRTDMFGLYAAAQAVEASGLLPFRDKLDAAAAADFNDRTGVFAGSGGGAYQNQYEFFPLIAAARGELATFGRRLDETVNPMWLLRNLPNNVLGHVGIRYGFKGANACITNHAVSGILAASEAAAAVAAGEADRALAVGHDAPLEPEMVVHYHRLGLLATDAVRPFDAARSGLLFGEGAASLVFERAEAARARGAEVLGEFLGSGCASDAAGLMAFRPDG
jgi:3-oxoacyl-[acyl-carrier-protein] synthase-1